MPVTRQSLLQALKELKHALADDAAGQEEAWSRRMNQALATLEQSLRRHRATLRDPEGRVVDMDTSTNPSPGMARRADQLHQELDKLLSEAHRLREKSKAVHPSQGVETPSTDAGALPVAPEVGDRTNFSVFCEQVEQIVAELEHYNEEEMHLIEDAITLDLGAGD